MRYLNCLALSLSVSVSAIASTPIEFDSPTSGRKVFSDKYKLEEEAWSLAYAGEFERAGRYLRRAARHGSKRAAQFLSNEYTYGGHICEKNPVAAQIFKEIFDDLKAKNRDKYSSDGDTHVLQNIALRLHNVALAQRTPWLAAVHSLFRTKLPTLYVRALIDHKWSIEMLLNQILENAAKPFRRNEPLTRNDKEQAINIIRDSVIALNDKDLFVRIFKVLEYGSPKTDFLLQILAIAQSSNFHSEQEKTELELVVGDNITCLQSTWYPQLVEQYSEQFSTLMGESPFNHIRSAVLSLATNQNMGRTKREALTAICGQVYQQLRSVPLKSSFAVALEEYESRGGTNATGRLMLLKVLLADKSLLTHRREELIRKTSTVLNRLCGIMLSGDTYDAREAAQAPFFECFSIFYDLDSAQALDYIKKLYHEDVRWARRAFRVQVLLALKERDEAFYRKECQKTLDEHLGGLMSLHVKTPGIRLQAEGSLLSIDATYNQMCQVLSQPPREEKKEKVEEILRAFHYFASCGPLLEAYAERISPLLGTFLANHPKLQSNYCDLLNQAPMVLRDPMFQALLTYLVMRKPETLLEVAQYKHTVDSLFNPDLRTFGYIKDKPVSFFRNIFEILSPTRADYPLQMLWKTMPLHASDVRLEMVRQIRAYFNLPARDPELGNTVPLKCKGIVARSLDECMTSNALPLSALHNFCEVTKRTGLYDNLPLYILTSLEDKVLWDPEAPLVQRYEAFNNKLQRAAEDGQLAGLKAACQERLPQSPLLSYASLAIQMLEFWPQPTSTMYALMAQMIELKKAHPEIRIPQDFILTNRISENVFKGGKVSQIGHSPENFTRLPNMKDTTIQHDENAPYVAINGLIEEPFLDQDGLYGLHSDCQFDYSLNGNFHRLYKYDPTTGNALWSVILDVPSDWDYPPYTVGSRYVFIMSGDNRVAMLEKTSGLLQRFTDIRSVIFNDKLSFIGATGDGLYAPVVWKDVHQDTKSAAYLCYFSEDWDRKDWSWLLPQSESGEYHFSTQGAYFICTSYGSSVLHFMKKFPTIVSINFDPFRCESTQSEHIAQTTVDGDHLYYTQQQMEGYHLVHLDLLTGAELWRTPLQDEPIQAPVLSAAKDSIFVLALTHLYALSTDPAAPGKILWSVSAHDEDRILDGFWQIALSADGRYVNATVTDTTKFYRYDVRTGKEEEIGDFKNNTFPSIIGNRADGKVIVQLK